MLGRPTEHNDNFLQIADLWPEGRQESPLKARRKILGSMSIYIGVYIFLFF